jgi:hypothetical protein
MSSVWRSLEKDFRDIPDTFGELRADWRDQPRIPNHWHLAGGASRGVYDRFKALAILAAKQLVQSPTAQNNLPQEILLEPDLFKRWLMAVRQLTGHFEPGPYGTLYDKGGVFAGHLLAGSIPKVIEASALSCLQLAVDDGLADQPVLSSVRIFIDDIESFAKVSEVDPKEVLPRLSQGRLEVEEDTIQTGLEAILDVPLHKKDWGGEENDLYTANLLVSGQRIPTAFMLKGRGLTATTLQLAHCGKNGDQILRLFQSPAELFVVQFVGIISENIVKDVESKARDLISQGRAARCCLIDGQDTARLLYAYGRLQGS